MKKILILLLITLCFITSGSAIGNPPVTGYDTVVRVKGLICSICGAGLKKKFKNHFLVKKIYIDIKTQNVYLKHVRDDTLIKSDEIKKMVEDSGYEVSLIKYIMKEETKKDKKQQTPIIKPEPALVELQRHPLTSRGEPHARYQQIIKELAQARLDKKKKSANKK